MSQTDLTRKIRYLGKKNKKTHKKNEKDTQNRICLDIKKEREEEEAKKYSRM